MPTWVAALLNETSNSLPDGFPIVKWTSMTLALGGISTPLGG